MFELDPDPPRFQMPQQPMPALAYVFGTVVNFEQHYVDMLSQALNSRFPGTQVEVAMTSSDTLQFLCAAMQSFEQMQVFVGAIQEEIWRIDTRVSFTVLNATLNLQQ